MRENRTYKGLITNLTENQIFVFGSNTQGIHGAGAALWALKNAGAIWGRSKGLQGQAYGIVTKNLNAKKHPSITVGYILFQLESLQVYAKLVPEKEFLIAYSGTGVNLNGYTPKQMANMFSTIEWPKNIVFEEEFAKLLTK